MGAINQSADMGAKDDRDKAVRELFRNVKFRRALSQGMDRDGITQAIMKGPFLRVARRRLPLAPEFDKPRWCTIRTMWTPPRRCWPSWAQGRRQ